MTELALVLLPGLDGSGVLFRPLLARLAFHLRPIVVSYPPDKILCYDELLSLVLQAIPKDVPFVLLGESFSGPLALMAAAKGIHNLQAVILCATFIRNPLWFRASWLSYFSRPILFRFFPEISRTKALFAGYATPELLALSRESLAAVTPRVLAHRVREVLRVDASQQLQSCPVPVLYLRGERDRVVPRHNMMEIMKIFPSVEVAQIPSPHWVLQTQPALAAQAISAFVGNLMSSKEQKA